MLLTGARRRSPCLVRSDAGSPSEGRRSLPAQTGSPREK